MPDIQSLAQIPVLAAIIVALVQVFKPEITNKAIVPAITVLVGIILGVVVQGALGHLDGITSYLQAGLFGMIAGLSATGLYENTLDKAAK